MSRDPDAVAAMTVSRARSWKPEALGLHGIAWQLAAQKITHEVTPVATAAADSGDYWAGASGDTARSRVAVIHADTVKIAAALDSAATAATAGALDIAGHRRTVIKHVDDALAALFDVADDGTVSASQKMYLTLVARVGAAMAQRAWIKLVADAADRTTTVQQGLADLLAADLRAGSAIRDAFGDDVFTTRASITNGANPLENMPAADASVESNRHWWNSLTESQQDQVIKTYPDQIGNRDGIPIEARDQANRLRLPALIAVAEDEQRTVAAQFGTGSDEYRAATAKLADLKAVDQAIKNPEPVAEGSKRHLILLDTTSGRQTRAAVSVGNPDKSTHVSVTTPGLDTTVRGGIGGMTNEAAALQSEAATQLGLAGRSGESVATVAWIGYDPPQVKGVWSEGQYGDAVSGVSEVSQTDQAAEGGQLLNRFYNGLEASHEGSQAPHITAVGHSYGSLTTGLALQAGEHPVEDMVVYGSPGIAAETPQQLGLDDGHAYVMRTDDDPIKWAQDGPVIVSEHGPVGVPGMGGPVLPVVADAWVEADNGGFGPDPAKNPNFTQLETRESTSEDGNERVLPGAAGHSEYPRDKDGAPRVTTYNVAAVVAGLPDNAVEKR
ncbi:alpha/beta hydrolase [Nocardia asteroides]|uniref:alpha/beta hydrolase n=1 Tax=Nocardia asteroides TaxID=1824 RepID=UPI001E538140|nr:alpha/beta hydrolase [Nocardia asteroides]UGT53966.1 alpha/beta hydrolase family protein [Nocardia asteroides]